MKYFLFLHLCLAFTSCLALRIPWLTEPHEDMIESIIPALEDEDVYETKEITIERTEDIVEDFSIDIITNTTHIDETETHQLSRRGKKKNKDVLDAIKPRCLRATRPLPRGDHEAAKNQLRLWCDLRYKLKPGEAHLAPGGNGGVVYFICNVNKWRGFFCDDHKHELEAADKLMDIECHDDRGAHLEWKSGEYLLSFGRAPKGFPINCAELKKQWRDIR